MAMFQVFVGDVAAKEVTEGAATSTMPVNV
jgi:hypothetical protein